MPDHKHSCVKEFVGFALLLAVTCGVLWWTTECENEAARERARHMEAR